MSGCQCPMCASDVVVYGEPRFVVSVAGQPVNVCLHFRGDPAAFGRFVATEIAEIVRRKRTPSPVHQTRSQPMNVHTETHKKHREMFNDLASVLVAAGGHVTVTDADRHTARRSAIQTHRIDDGTEFEIVARPELTTADYDALAAHEERERVADELRGLATDRFVNHGANDVRGAALWDAASWLTARQN